ncbi:MAG: efflux transporter outer membrane subunit [bacterium]
MKLSVSLGAAILVLAGCTQGPDYVKPDIPTPPAWHISLPDAQQAANQRWWLLFDDPVLNELVQSALENNRDLKRATARISEFAARVEIASAGFYPQLGYGASGSRAANSANTLGSGGISTIGNNFDAALNVGWELDFWGRIQRSTEAARADLLAAEHGRYSVILTLVSSVATSYVTLRNLDEQLEIAKDTLERRAGAVELFEIQFEGGVVSELEVAQIRSEYEITEVAIPAIEQQIALLENALSVLVGRNPGPIPRGKTIEELVLPGVPADIPADVMLRRPDIKSAEQNLIAANAQIGIARAEYFPSISLTGLLGVASADLDDLLENASKVWNIAGAASGPLYTGGRLDAQVAVAESVTEQAIYNYQQTLLIAFQEVEDALVSIQKTREQLAARGRQVDALKEYARLARIRYDEGYVSYIEVLDSERRLFDAELEYTKTQGNLYSALISAYKAMGGGWEPES